MFGLGLGRTGTKSLGEALSILGLSCCHWPEDSVIEAEVENGVIISGVVETYDAILDCIPLILHYQEYEQRFPSARFILTTRDIDTWIDSMVTHLERISIHSPGRFLDTVYRTKILGLEDPNKIDRERLRQAYIKHVDHVRAFFKNKSERFLEIDICAGSDWSQLCPFLGKSEPEIDFPLIQQRPDSGSVFIHVPRRRSIGLVTMVLPRMEIDHIRDWLIWHYKLGIRHVWIACDQDSILDQVIGQENGHFWQKKPHANFNPHLTGEQARNTFKEEVRKAQYELPHMNIWLLEVENDNRLGAPSVGERQVLVANHVADSVVGLLDWVCLLDVDELLEEHAIELSRKVIHQSPDVATLRMNRQILMDDRFVNGSSIQYSDIDISWGAIPNIGDPYMGNGKSMVRPGAGRWISPHRSRATIQGYKDATSDDILFYHFHGIEVSECSRRLGWDLVYDWARVNREPEAGRSIEMTLVHEIEATRCNS